LHTGAEEFTGLASKLHTSILYKHGAEIPCRILLLATNIPLHSGKINNSFET
jgi:hypothetical protein